MRALAAPASLKGVLSAADAADALAQGLSAGGAVADALAVADGGDGTLDVLERALSASRRSTTVTAPLGGQVVAEWLLLGDGTAVVESAQALGFATVDRLDPLRASSRGLGELILAATGEADALLVCLGGTVTVDGGAGMREVLDELPLPTRVACDVLSPLLDAVHVFGAQKGATPEQLPALEERLRGLPDVAGSGAGGGLGGAFLSLGATLVPGAKLVLDLIGFDPRGYDLVVTGEGAVDATTYVGKAPGEVVQRCDSAGVRYHLFSARDDLSGDQAQAREDLVALGRHLGGARGSG
jgi:glycerate 2-kinase